MLGSDVYESVLAYLRKDKRGLSLSLAEFNTHSTMVDKRILIAFCSRYEDDIEISSHMGFLKVLDYPLTLTSGIASLPTNYFRLSGDPYYYDSDGIMRPIDVRTSMEHSYHERDYLTKASLKYPACVIGSQDSSTPKQLQIRVYPTTITTIYINYVRDTTSPFQDYYIDGTNLQPVYMTAGQQNVSIVSPNEYRDGTTGTKNSLTVDWEWDIHEKPWIVAYFLQALGATIPDELLLQVGKMDSAEIQSGSVW
jgi:hypothetical protein